MQALSPAADAQHSVLVMTGHRQALARGAVFRPNKLSPAQRDAMRLMVASGASQSEAAEAFGVTRSAVVAILRNHGPLSADAIGPTDPETSFEAQSRRVSVGMAKAAQRRGGRLFLTREERNRVLQAVDAGATVAETARAFGIERAAVRYHVKKRDGAQA